MSEPDTRDLRDWLQTLIQESREREEELQPMLDLSEPCQLEVFWLNDDIEGQVIVNTTDSNRDDQEILIHGPFQGDEFVEEVGKVAQEKRWQEPLPDSSMLAFLERQESKKADALAAFIGRFVQQVQNSIFGDFSFTNEPLLESMRLWDGCYTNLTLGDVKENEISELFEEETDNRQGPTESSQTGESDPSNSPEAQEEKPGGGGHIYPPVWIESPPKKTFEQKVWNTAEISHDIVLRENFLDDELVVLRDGLILVLTEDGERIREILNTIFSVGVLLDVDWRALQGRELVSARVGPDRMRGHQAELSTQRRELLSPNSDSTTPPRGVIPAEGLREIINLAEDIYSSEDLREKLLLHLQAHTHLLDFEYTASFLLNWNIIEQQIIDILDPHLRDKYDVNRDRRGSIKDGSHWFISHMLEVAEITDAIQDNEYSQLDEFRSKRNKIVHDMETASEEQAENLHEIVSTFLEREIDTMLEDS